MANNQQFTYKIGFTADTSQLEASLRKATESLQKISSDPNNQLAPRLREAAQAATELEAHLSSAFNRTTGKLDLSALQRGLQQSGMQLDEYARKLAAVGPTGQQAFLQVAQAISSAQLPLRRSSAMLDKLWITMKNTARWQLTSGMLHGFIGAVQTAYGYTQDLNESLNSIRIVTGQSVEQMDKFAARANEAAKRLSTTTTRYTDAALIYYQQGLSDEEVAGRTDVTIKLANAAGEAAETASEQLTAVWNNFYDGTKSLEYYADVMTALGATTASSTQEISQGLQKFAAVADTVGLSYEYAAAALATVTATTRESADIVGTAFRTLFGRLESLKLGETLDDGTTLNKYSQALKNVGVDVKDVSGNLKDMDDILSETMAKWETLTRDQQMALAQTVAGVRQYSQFIALMDNADFFRTNLETAQNATGALQEQADIYAESWEAARDRVKAAAQDVYESLFNDEAFISIDDAIAKILDRVDNVVDTFGGLSGTLNVVFNLMTQLYGARMAQGIDNQVFNLQKSLGISDQLALSFKEQASALRDELMATQSQVPEVQQLANAQKDAYNLIDELWAKFSSSSERMTEEQKVWFQTLLQNLTKAQESMNEYRNEVEAAADAHARLKEEVQKTLQESHGRSTVETLLKNTIRPDEKRYLLGIEGIQGIGVPRRSAIEVTDSAAFRSMENVTALSNEYQRLSAEFSKNNLEITRLNRSISKGAQNTEELKERIAALSNENEILTTHQQTLEKLFARLGYSGQEFEEILERIRTGEDDLANSAVGATDRMKSLSSAGETARKSLDSLTNTSWTLGSALVAVSQAASSIAISINAIRSIGRVFSDEDMSATDRITTVLMSMSMLLGTANNALNLFSKTQAGSTLITKLLALEEGEEIAVKGQGVIATAAARKASEYYTAAKGTETAAVNAATASQIAATAALKGYLVTLGPILLILAAVTAGIYVAVKAYNADADAAKKATEAHEEASKAANEAKQAYQDLVTTVEGYDKAAAAIKDLEEGTDEYREAVEKANEKARELLEIHRELRGYSHYENGLLVIDSGRLEQVTRQAAQNQLSANLYDSVLGIAEERANVVAEATRLRRSAPSLSGRFIEDSATGNYTIPRQELEFALNRLIEKGINPLEGTELSKYSTNVQEALQGMASAIEDFIEVQTEANHVIDSYNQDLARNVLSQDANFGNLSVSSQDALAAILSRIDTSERREALRGQLINSYYLSDTTPNNDMDNVVDYDKIAEEYARRKGYDKVIKAYSLSGKASFASGEEIIKASVSDMLDYLTSTDATQMAIEEVSESAKEIYQTLSTSAIEAGGREFASALDKFIASGTLDTSQISPKMVEELETMLSDGSELSTALKDLGEKNGQDYLESLLNQLQSSDPTLWQNAIEAQFQGMADAASHALEVLATTKESLSSDELRNLSAAFGDLFNFSGLENASALDQVLSVTKALQSIGSDRGIQARIDAINKELEELGENAPKELVNELEKLEHIKLNPIKLEVEIEDQAIDALSNTFKRASKLIDKDYKVAFDNVAELVKLVPEVLEGATADMEAGIVQLNKDILNTIDDIALAELGINKEHYTQAIKDQITTAQTTQTILHNVYNTIDTESEESAIKAIQAEAKSVSEIGQISKAMVLGKVKDFLTIRAQDDTRTQEAVVNENAVGKAGEEQAGRVAQSFNNAYADIVEDSANAAVAQIKNFTAITHRDLSLVSRNASRVTRNYLTGSDSSTEINYSGVKTRDYSLTEQWLNSHGNVSKMGLNEDEFNQLTSQLGSILGQEVTNGFVFKLDDEVISAATEKNQAFYEGIIRDALKSEGTIDAIRDGMDANADWLGYLFERLASVYGVDLTNRERESSNSGTEKKTKDKQYERYHEITREIAKQSDLLKEIDTETDRAYGTTRLNLYRKSIEALTQQQANYNQKAKEASDYLSGDRKELEGLNAKYGLGLLFDAKGEIDQYDEFIERMTKMRDNASGVFTDDDYTIVMNAIKRYEEALDTQRENLQLADDIAREIEDQKLNEINYKLEVALNVKEVKQQVNDISKSIAESYGNALTHTLTNKTKSFTGIADLNKANVQIEIDKLNDYQEKAKDLDNLLTNATDKASIDAIVSEQQDLIDKLGESIDMLLEWVDYWENMIPEALDAASEHLAQFTDQLDHNVSILDTIKELYALQGQTYKTTQGFARLQRVTQEQMDAQVTQAQLNKEYFEGIATELEKAEKALANAKVDEYNIAYDTLKNNRDALLAQYNEAQAAYLSSAKAAMESARDMYSQQLERAAYEFGKAIAGNGDLDFVNEQYDHFIEGEAHYLDAVNKAYQEQLWSRKVMLDYDNATNEAHKDLIKAFEAEKNALFARNEINEYDLEVLEARYKVMQAEIALRDAEGAKNHLQLVRDRQGNWNYQYTSDADDIAKAEQDLADAQNDWYNIAKQQTKDVTGEITKLWKDSQSAVKDILNNMELTETERSERIAEIQRYYSEKAQDLYRDRDQAMADMTEAGKLRLDDYGGKYETTLTGMTGNNAAYQQALNEYIELCKSDMESYQSTVASVADQSGTKLSELDSAVRKVADANDELKKKGTDAVDTLVSRIKDIHNLSLSWQELAKSVEEAYNKMQQMAQQESKNIEVESGLSPAEEDASSVWYDKNRDYHHDMRKYVENYLNDNRGSTARDAISSIGYQTLEEQRNAKIKGEGITGVESSDDLRKKFLATYATGGYTGEWGNEGKLALLHEKELVLNSSDTSNILAAVEAIRAIEHGLDSSVAVMMGSLLMRTSGTISPAAISNDNGTVNQYTIYFPGVTDHTEIELALRNLANDADQWSEIKSN